MGAEVRLDPPRFDIGIRGIGDTVTSKLLARKRPRLIRADGSPHSVPLWVGLACEHIAVLTSPGSRKARNLARAAGQAHGW